MPAAAELGGLWSGNSSGVRAIGALAAGDVCTADTAARIALEQLAGAPFHQGMYVYLAAEVASATGDTVTVSHADEAVVVAKEVASRLFV